ncbi:MAG TPA: 1-deoxy-D-xylulose-5-phosphate reductoisomerase [Deltaproteobacteria bacterium]|nr:1-deoxy-D-xylulose-5-phosphate reductoisomerase [Deltaproteobacteria bacterium]
MTKVLALLGSTGSIGRSTLDVVRRHGGRFRVAALAAGRNVELLKEQVRQFRPAFVSVETEEGACEMERFVSALDFPVEVGWGGEGALRAAVFEGVDMVVSAMVGAAGLVPTVAAIRAGRDIALANKETLVLGGPLVMEEARRAGARLLPVDSEHSAVYQSLRGHRREDVRRVILTASGGPFLATPVERLASVTPEQALAHPNWSMGRRITVDSATLMNKGLEVIEACRLFDLPPSMVAVRIHPQSVVHSMVEYVDGSVICQMSVPDMRGPIAYALSCPERVECGVEGVDFSSLTLEFREPDPRRSRCLELAYEAMESGGTMPAALNAADEVAVDAFLGGRIRFTDIAAVVEAVTSRHRPRSLRSMDDILWADEWARDEARAVVEGLCLDDGVGRSGASAL